MLQTNICKSGITTANKNIYFLYLCETKTNGAICHNKTRCFRINKDNCLYFRVIGGGISIKDTLLLYTLRVYIFTCAEIYKLSEM